MIDCPILLLADNFAAPHRCVINSSAHSVRLTVEEGSAQLLDTEKLIDEAVEDGTFFRTLPGGSGQLN